MISEWPIRAGAGAAAPREPGALPRQGALASRLDEATTDLFLNATNRVSDRVRASASAMLDGVVGAIERDMRLLLQPYFIDRAELSASLASASVAIAVPLLGDAGTLRHPPLVAILLRRAGEHLLTSRILPAGADGGGLPIDDTDEEIAAAAMALLIAGARRLDRFGEPALLVDDLPAELADWLIWQVAAALRHYLRVYHQVPTTTADPLLVEAAAQVRAAHDEGRGLAATAAWLAGRLVAHARVDGEMLAALLAAGQATAFTATLAAATQLPQDEVWNVIVDPLDGRLALLLCAAGVGRAPAAAIVVTLIGGQGDAGNEMAFFDRFDEAHASRAVAPLAMAPEYRAAILAVDAALAVREART